MSSHVNVPAAANGESEQKTPSVLPLARSRAIAALDVVATAVLLIALSVYLTGGFRERTPFGRLSVTSWLRPLVIGLVALGVRHLLQPRPTIFAWLNHCRTRALQVSGVREAIPLVIATRTAVFIVGFLAVTLFGYPADVRPWYIHQNEFLNLPARWDTGWYLQIATEGYQWLPSRSTQQQNIVFFPVYPMLMRYGSIFLARQVMWTGVLVSWIAFSCAMVYLYRFVRERHSADAASTTIALIACYPFALFFGTAYTEALFLLTTVAACYHFERNELWKAGAWGLVAGLSRPNGCLLSVALAFIALRPLWPLRRGELRIADWIGVAGRIAVAAMPGIGMLIYSTYIFFLTGNPLQWAAQNAAWGRVYRGLDAVVTEQAYNISGEGLYTYAATRTIDALYVATVLFMLATVWPVLRRVGVPYAVLIVVNLLPPLMMGGLLSIGRVTSVLFPAFIWLALAIPPTHRTAWLSTFAMLQAICAAMFFTWRPLY